MGELFCEGLPGIGVFRGIEEGAVLWKVAIKIVDLVWRGTFKGECREGFASHEGAWSDGFKVGRKDDVGQFSAPFKGEFLD